MTLKTGIECRDLSNLSKFDSRFRASIALILIVGITTQLCQIPDISKFIYTSDSSFEQLDQVDEYSGDPEDISIFISPDVFIPVVIYRQLNTAPKASLLIRLLPASHSIRFPPFLSQNLAVVS